MYKGKRPAAVRQGQIYDIDLPAGKGSVQSGYRPVVITSANRQNSKSPTVIVAVVTSRIKRPDLAEHVVLPMIDGLPKRSMVCTEQRFTVDKSQLLKYRGKLPWEIWKEVHRALRLSEQTSLRSYENKKDRLSSMRSGINASLTKNNRATTIYEVAEEENI